MEYPRAFRRDPDQVLLFLAKELATAASMDGDRAIFIGRRNPDSFRVLFERYVKAAVEVKETSIPCLRGMWG